ncbi:MAG TPA: Ricin and poly(3-hydroxybutyrate) depolymerase fusion [Polyangiaceae bacterium]|nr:Ricin and poly(3-hydroxybutyrate) depolymerase fusion [Polyangiaceae bacterium]
MELKAKPPVLVAVLACLSVACSSSGSNSDGAQGGSHASGGHGPVAAAGQAQGGSANAAGGTATGGTFGSAGMTAAGGASSGGVSSGGTSSGTGGTSSGTGGKGVGGSSSSGGKSGSGGAAHGGSAGASTSGGASGSGPSTGGTGSTGDVTKSAGCGKTPTLKSGNGQTFAVSGGGNRTFNLKVPDPYDNSKPYRLIVGYHWLNGTANDVSNGGGTIKSFYGLWDLAAGSTIFVAPQGLNNGWSNTGGADVEFSRQLLAKLEDEFCIDKSRVFCEGFSMGGSMSYAMACAMPEAIRAVAVHSGGPMSGCVAHSKPVPYFMTHGTKDSVCTYPGFGVPQLQDFAKLDGCTKPDPTASATAFEAALPEPTSTASACVQFEGCKAGYPVRSCLFVGDHTPSPDGTSGWVPKETWKFISQF